MRNYFLLIFITFCGLSEASSEYDDAIKVAETIRSELHMEYDSDISVEKKNELLKRANLIFQDIIVNSLAPPWYGTKWDFNGTSQEPGEGEIACGYFVTTLLRDAGVKLQRVKLAQQASENIIKSLVSSSSIRRYSDQPLDEFLSSVKKMGLGIYIVGLDQHVGFISVESEDIYFIHSSYISPYAVTRDVASESYILKSSRYRVIGRLFDKKFLEGWMYRHQFQISYK